MPEHTHHLTDNSGNSFFIYEWLPDKTTSPRAVIQIVHGMMEHAGRYHAFAEFLTSHGLAVVAEDHQGHGRTAGNAKNLGHLDGKTGWQMILEQIHTVMTRIRERFPGIPYIIMGHSMGSMLARHAAILYGSSTDGLILSGTDYTTTFLIKAGNILANCSSFLYGKHYRNHMINFLVYKTFNRHFKSNRTAFEWLSTDNQQVDRYVADPMCGYPSTSGFYQGMFYGLGIINQLKQLSLISARLPVLILSGEKDPVGEFSKGPHKIANQLRKAGISDVTMILYPEGRHEMLNEKNRISVYEDITHWINEKISIQTNQCINQIHDP